MRPRHCRRSAVVTGANGRAFFIDPVRYRARDAKDDGIAGAAPAFIPAPELKDAGDSAKELTHHAFINAPLRCKLRRGEQVFFHRRLSPALSVDSLRDLARNSQRDVPALTARNATTDFEDARHVDENPANGALVELPRFGQFGGREMTFGRVRH